MERNTDLREKQQSVASHTCSDWDEPTTQACALTRTRNRHLLLCGKTPNQLSHTNWGDMHILDRKKGDVIWCVEYFGQ